MGSHGAPKIQNSLTQQQENVVECVGPCSYAEPPQQIETAEEESGDRAEYKGIDVEAIAIRADIVESGEDQRAEHGCGQPRDEGPPAEQLGGAPRNQADQHDAKQQLFVDSGADGQHEQRPAAQLLAAETE